MPNPSEWHSIIRPRHAIFSGINRIGVIERHQNIQGEVEGVYMHAFMFLL